MDSSSFDKCALTGEQEHGIVWGEPLEALPRLRFAGGSVPAQWEPFDFPPPGFHSPSRALDSLRGPGLRSWIAEPSVRRQNNPMRIVLRNDRRQRLFAVDVDLSSPPTIVHSSAEDGQVAHLDWDRVLDDERHLRRCPACGCSHLFAHKVLPQWAGLGLIVLAAVMAMGLYYLGNSMWAALLVLVGVLAVDGAIYVVAPRELVCYRCHSAFRGMPIRRDHARWQKSLSERYRLSEGNGDAGSPAGASGRASAGEGGGMDASGQVDQPDGAGAPDRREHRRKGAQVP